MFLVVFIFPTGSHEIGDQSLFGHAPPVQPEVSLIGFLAAPAAAHHLPRGGDGGGDKHDGDGGEGEKEGGREWSALTPQSENNM